MWWTVKEKGVFVDRGEPGTRGRMFGAVCGDEYRPRGECRAAVLPRKEGARYFFLTGFLFALPGGGLPVRGAGAPFFPLS